MQVVTSTSVPFPFTSRDALTSILRHGAQQTLTRAIEAEVAGWIGSHRHLANERDPRPQSAHCPQSNGEIERWHGTFKRDYLRPNVPLSIDVARWLVAEFVTHYNQARLHSVNGYVTPADKPAGREVAIFAERDRKLTLARERRAAKRREATHPAACETGTQRKASGSRGGDEPLVCLNANNSLVAIAALQLIED